MLVTRLKVDQVLGYFAAGTAAKKSDIVDMAGYEGCMFIFEFGTLIEAGVLTAVINGNTLDATGGTALDAGVAHTNTAVDAALTHSALVVDIYQPEPSLYRYLEAQITPSVQNAVLLGITAIRYNGKVKPEITTGLLEAIAAVSPAAA